MKTRMSERLHHSTLKAYVQEKKWSNFKWIVLFWVSARQFHNWFESVLPTFGQMEWCYRNRIGQNWLTETFQHDNAKSETSLMTSQKLLQLGWHVLPQPAHLPDPVRSGVKKKPLGSKTILASYRVKVKGIVPKNCVFL